MQKNDNTIVNPNPPRGGGHVLRKQRSCESYLDTERREQLLQRVRVSLI